MRVQYIDDLVFDGSTNPGTVELNGWRLKFDSDEDAKDVFELLYTQRGASDSIIGRLRQIAQAVDSLRETIE